MLYLKDLITKETPIIKVANDSSVTEIEKMVITDQTTLHTLYQEEKIILK